MGLDWQAVYRVPFQPLGKRVAQVAPWTGAYSPRVSFRRRLHHQCSSAPACVTSLDLPRGDAVSILAR